MSDRNDFDWLSDGIAAVLRIGTLVAVGIIAIGYVIGLVGGFGDGERPLFELIGGGGPAVHGRDRAARHDTAAGRGAHRGRHRLRASGERGRMLTSIAVLGLLLASLVTAAILAQAG
jgi:hypothetical protein